MTRAEWIQRYVLDACRTGEWNDEETVDDANHVADALEKSGTAPWSTVTLRLADGDVFEVSEEVAAAWNRKPEIATAVAAERSACAALAIDAAKRCHESGDTAPASVILRALASDILASVR